MRSRFARWPRATLLGLQLAGVALLGGGLEVAYRGQVIDFYRAELLRGNPASLAEDGRPVLLVLGDSFAADSDGFVATLRREQPAWRVVGAGVSGFTSRQLLRVAPPRLRQFRPRAVLVQLYAGNDLLERLHPPELRGPTPRGLFWTLSDLGLEGPGWLNYRAGQTWNALRRALLAPISPQRKAALEARPFSVELFTERDRALIGAAPGHLEDQLALTGPAAVAFAPYAAELSELLALLRDGGVRACLLPVPHAVQASDRYLARYVALGARFRRSDWAHVEAPFQAALRALAAGSGADLVDPLPAFREAEAAGHALYRNNDSHLAPEGAALLGRVAAEAQRPPR